MNWMWGHCVTRFCRMLACFSMLTEDPCSSFRVTGVHMTTLEVWTTWSQVTQSHQTLQAPESTILQWAIQGLGGILCHRHAVGTHWGQGFWSPSCSMCVPVQHCRKWRRKRRSEFPGGQGLLAMWHRAGILSTYLMHTRSVPENSISKMMRGGGLPPGCFYVSWGVYTYCFSLLCYNCTGKYCAQYWPMQFMTLNLERFAQLNVRNLLKMCLHSFNYVVQIVVCLGKPWDVISVHITCWQVCMFVWCSAFLHKTWAIFKLVEIMHCWFHLCIRCCSLWKLYKNYKRWILL